uniref:DDE Tnp4 domain-containing protein n=1 Tax=Ditylenchus dipsaci TaxID=166011 RepID=A0A915DW98_9BILA
MEDSALLNAIAWWFFAQEKKHVRPAHYQAAFQRNSLKLSGDTTAVRMKGFDSLSIGTLPDSSSTDTGHGKACHFSQIHCVGPTYCAVAHLFAIGDSTVYDICKEVSQAIVTVMQAEFMPPPNVRHGKVDGKHIAIVKPEHSGAAFFNYKMRNLVFIAVDVGPQEEIATLLYGSQARLGHFSNPPEADLRRVRGYAAHVFLDDGGFGCTDLIMTPFTDRGADTQGKIAFNGRLSRARECSGACIRDFSKEDGAFFGNDRSPARNRSTLHDCSRNSAQLLETPHHDDDGINIRFPDDRRLLVDQERQKPEELEEELGNNLLML